MLFSIKARWLSSQRPVLQLRNYQLLNITPCKDSQFLAQSLIKLTIVYNQVQQCMLYLDFWNYHKLITFKVGSSSSGMCDG